MMSALGTPLYDCHFRLTSIDGTAVEMDDYRGRVLLIVNVASRCGYTGQYAGLERLYRSHRGRGFSVLGFPCDQFGHQEPLGERAIQEFCSQTYDVTFPMFAKIHVNGRDAHPLYEFLKAQQKGPIGLKRVLWNFTKFLVNRDGAVLARHGSRTAPAELEPAIEDALGTPGV